LIIRDWRARKYGGNNGLFQIFELKNSEKTRKIKVLNREHFKGANAKV
jgi:hypothetical protein